MDSQLGEIILFAGNFAPRGWKFCNGELLPIAQNDALYALIGTTYGGDGQSTFALPDLRGRIPIHQGLQYYIGQAGGTEKAVLSINQIPAHGHTVTGTITYKTRGDSAGNFSTPDDHVIAQAPLKKFFGRTPGATMAALNSSTNIIGPIGSNEPHDNMQPFCAIHFIIATEGYFPSRN